MKNSIRLMFLLGGVLLCGCSSVKQVSHTVSPNVKWNDYSSFSFLPAEYEQVPASINPSIIQNIEEGIVKIMDKKGFEYRGSEDSTLLILLRISFGKSFFVDADDMNAYVKSKKYKTSSLSKKGNYFKEGSIQMEIFDSKNQDLVWMSRVKGFVCEDGSEVLKESKLRKSVPAALFSGFPKTGKPSISSLKRKKEAQNERQVEYYY